MDDRVIEWLQDIVEQARAVEAFTAGLTFQAYTRDAKTQAAVERKFEIMGEALNRIRRVDESLLDQIRDCRSIISFRNILEHGYDSIEDRIGWGIIENDLHHLLADVTTILNV